jgi:glycine dehydrogenase
MAGKNRVLKSLIGMGYSDTLTPKVIVRNVLENPGWYTAYTPYQAEIAQGRLEALLNYQQMVIDLTGMELANASLLDEATAAAEAMTMARRVSKAKSNRFFVDAACFPQTIDVIKTRAGFFGFELVFGRPEEAALQEVFGALFQYPNDAGEIADLSQTDCRRQGARRHRRRGLRPDGAGAAQIARRNGRRHRARFVAALRRADGLRRPARRLLRHARRVQALGRRAHHRRLGRRARQQGAAHGAANARTAHPARERPTRISAPRRSCSPTWPACTRSITGRKGCASSPSASTGWRRFSRGAAARRHRRAHHEFLRYLARRPRHHARVVAQAALAAGYNLREVGGGVLGIAFNEKSTRDDVARPDQADRRHQPSTSKRWMRSCRRPTRPCRKPCGAPTPSSRTRCSTATTPNTRCCAT